MLGSVCSFKCNIPPLPLFERRSKATLHFPANIKSAKDRAIFCVDLGVEIFGSLFWIALPSSTRSFRLPSFHNCNVLSRHAACSLALEALCGFCRRRIGRISGAVLSAIARLESRGRGKR